MDSVYERMLEGVNPRVIEHARRLVIGGRVSLAFQVDVDGLIEAEVLDPQPNPCSWHFEGRVATGECSCRVAQVRALCVHLAAVLIALDDAGEKVHVEEPFSVRLVADSSESEGVFGDEMSALEQLGRLLRFEIPRTDRAPPKWWVTALGDTTHAQGASGNSTPVAHEFRFTVAEPRANVVAIHGPNPVEFTVLHVTRALKRDGTLSKPKPARAYDRQTPGPGFDAMRRVTALLDGAVDPAPSARTWDFYRQPAQQDRFSVKWNLRAASARPLLEELCKSGLLRWADPFDLGEEPTMTFDPSAYRLVIRGSRDREGNLQVEASLKRGAAEVAMNDVRAITRSGVIVLHDRIALLEHAPLAGLARALLDDETLPIPAADIRPFVQQMLALKHAPDLDLPPELMPRDRSTPLVAQFDIELAARGKRLSGRVGFVYDGRPAPLHAGPAHWFDVADWSIARRDLESEARRLSELRGLGLEPAPGGDVVTFPVDQLHEVVRTLHPAGWVVRASGQKLRAPSRFSVAVKSSGIDWFDLAGSATFGDLEVSLPRLLEAIERGRDTVILDDGSVGMIPTHWLAARRGLLAAGKKQDDVLRFKGIHAALLGAVLDPDEDERAVAPAIDVDAAFARVLESIRRGEKPQAEEPHESFRGELRPYQREGLGWMRHLLKLGLGGCLADDMGLGKTVQVLALLAGRVTKGRKAKPSLVVAPRSVALNWVAEATRFAPDLVVAPYYGPERAEALELVRSGGVLVTTYGTLRNDEALDEIDFDVVVLDEAQAIKNRDTITARAARDLRADHRLALSGTPVENHFGDVLSLFDFLNPGLLGRKGAKRLGDEAERPVLLRALRPFILRRTKREVAPDLPDRTEQTIFCTLEPDQRKLYDELRHHYRNVLLERVAREGMNGARFQVLEALLRLRQAACHPKLVDDSRPDEHSAKLDALLPRVQEVVAEGSKALVFSQFTSFLALLKPRLDQLGIPYEYLDGQTRDRQERVTRFQSDAACPLFLISLKAGGLGLNLTAAEYVFLLDPWWNPAVEAQAIDRAHRIGQTRAVFAYRLLAKDTVEERVAELQARKRELFDSLMSDTATLRDFDVEDLRALLS